MAAPGQASGWARAAGLASGGIRTFAGIVLAGVMMVTVVDVAGRYALRMPLPGASEITEILMAVLIYVGLPVVSQRNAHIAVDLFGGLVPKALAPARDAAIRILCAAVLGIVAWRLWLYAGQLSRDVTEYLKLPQAPFVFALSVLAGIAALVELYRAVRPVPPGGETAGDGA